MITALPAPDKQHRLNRDYLNDLFYIAQNLEFLNSDLGYEEYCDPKRQYARLVDFSKISEAEAAPIVKLLSGSAAPLLLKKVRTYEEYFADKAATPQNPEFADSEPNICNENIFLRLDLAEKVKVLQASAQVVLNSADDGKITIKIFPQRILHILGFIYDMVGPENPSKFKPKSYPAVITIKDLSAEQYQAMCERCNTIIGR